MEEDEVGMGFHSGIGDRLYTTPSDAPNASSGCRYSALRMGLSTIFLP